MSERTGEGPLQNDDVFMLSCGIESGLLMSFPVLLARAGSEMEARTAVRKPFRETFAWQARRSVTMHLGAVCGSAMMHRDRSLSSLESGESRDAAALAASGKNLFAVASELLLVLPSQHVANGAQAKHEDAASSSKATHRTLDNMGHQLTLPCPYLRTRLHRAKT